MRKILFIINPNAGKRIPDIIVNLIRKQFPAGIDYQITIWKNKNDFSEISNQLLNNGYTDAIAVGGDGTVNQVAKSLLNTKISLGIIPIGSGNGLARTLGLSMKVSEVLREIVKGKTIMIDHGIVNDTPFFCTSGIGFDAHIGSLFASSTTRGLRTYANITVRELMRYKAKSYTITVNNEVLKRKAFLITVANAGQYGNDFYIAPQAELSDGLFHIAILKPFNVFNVTGIFSKIMRRKAHLSASIETLVASSLKIEMENDGAIHFDGEPKVEKKVVNFENKPASLRVIVGEKFVAVKKVA